ncbi:hypothetical protein CF85_gp38 [Oenococcus phage phiS13]|uniref:Uncharacterized protein n=1 Tax=Oenococcus phage phiS13 TaxID=1432848 RepID=V5US71_9CAUD|nr:hypothetical protein CF85_gp38 [Oenococcus phage phiS13]AHB80377.1 hypothetical protein [Oenococcus phage phiS13]
MATIQFIDLRFRNSYFVFACKLKAIILLMIAMINTINFMSIPKQKDNHTVDSNDWLSF